MGYYKDLLAYKKGYELAMKIFHLSKGFPSEERFSLTDQIRRSSRSVCTNIAEGMRKRGYRKHVISKFTDAETENAETEVWLDFAVDCNYINQSEYAQLLALNDEVGKLIWYMLNHPDKFT